MVKKRNSSPYHYTPYYISPSFGDVIFTAGIWERWRQPDGNFLTTFAIITTAANECLNELHDRMRVIINPNKVEEWLENTPSIDEVNFANWVSMKFHRVGGAVNNWRNNGESLVVPI